MSQNSLSFRDVLDLAISSGDPGAVNFNLLRKIIDSILKETNLLNKPSSFLIPDPVRLSAAAKPPSFIANPDPIASALADRITTLESTLTAISNIPTNQELIDAGTGKAVPKRQVSDLYQILKLNGRIDGLEGAVDKVVSLVDDLLAQGEKIDSLEQTTHALAEIDRGLQKQLDKFGTPDTANAEIATWAGLYKAMQGKLPPGSTPGPTASPSSAGPLKEKPQTARQASDVKAAAVPEPPRPKTAPSERREERAESKTADKAHAEAKRTDVQDPASAGPRSTTNESSDPQAQSAPAGPVRTVPERPPTAAGTIPTASNPTSTGRKKESAGITGETQTPRDLMEPLLRQLNENVALHTKNIKQLASTKADQNDVAAKFEETASDLADQAHRAEMAVQEIRAIKAEFDDLTKNFEELNSVSRRSTVRSGFKWEPERRGSGSSVSIPSRASTHNASPVPVRKSQVCTAYPNEPCPDGTHPAPVRGKPGGPAVGVTAAQLQNLEAELDALRRRYEKLQSFVDEQVINLSEQQHVLQTDIRDVIQMFKERRRPNLKVENLDMNLVEKMLDDYDQIILEMKGYDVMSKELMQKTDRLFFLNDDLKRTKADSRLIRDSLEQKADLEDLHEKAGRAEMQEFIRSAGVQIATLSRQVQCNESVIKNELGKLLETIGTRAPRNSVDQLQSYVQDLTDTLEEKLADRTALRYAAGSRAPLHCVSCGDDVMQEARPDTSIYPWFPSRDPMSPYNAFGRNNPHEDRGVQYPTRFHSVSPRRPSRLRAQPRRKSRPNNYSAMIDENYEDMVLRKQYASKAKVAGSASQYAKQHPMPPSGRPAGIRPGVRNGQNSRKGNYKKELG